MAAMAPQSAMRCTRGVQCMRSIAPPTGPTVLSSARIRAVTRVLSPNEGRGGHAGTGQCYELVPSRGHPRIVPEQQPPEATSADNSPWKDRRLVVQTVCLSTPIVASGATLDHRDSSSIDRTGRCIRWDARSLLHGSRDRAR